jgi:hypothetical protein
LLSSLYLHIHIPHFRLKMGGKKATSKTKTPISHLEAALGFIAGSKGLACDSEAGRAPKVRKLLICLKAVCIAYATNATPERLRKRDNGETEAVRAVSLKGVTTTRGLFALVQGQVKEFMAAGEAIVRVGVKRDSASPTTRDLIAGFVMKAESSRSGKDQSWEFLPQEMRDRSVETGVGARMKL